LGGLIVCLAIWVLGVPRILAAEFNFTKIADLSTPIPGGTGNFTSFGVPSIDNGSIAFIGSGTSSQHGVYLGTLGGGIVKLADTNTPIPSGVGNFTSFGAIASAIRPVSIDAGAVAFVGRGSGGQNGIYLWTAAAGLSKVVDTATAVPGGVGAFTFFSNPSLDDGAVAFHAQAGAQFGIYTTLGGVGVARIADLTTAVPGAVGTFTGFGTVQNSRPSLDDGVVVFQGHRASDIGVYSYSPSAGLGKIVGAGTLSSDGKTLLGASNPSNDGDASVFVAGHAGSAQSIFASVAHDAPALIADLSTIVPGTTLPFSAFMPVGPGAAIDDGTVAFLGRFNQNASTVRSGIYAWAGVS
jgi:hypothetical protein